MPVVPRALRHIAISPWARRAYLDIIRYPVSEITLAEIEIAGLVTSQENACRYCYGTGRARMKMIGFSDEMIDRIERNVQLAEADPRERELVTFCRNLARSKPRPSRQARETLREVGFETLATAELAFIVAAGGFCNRVSTLLAVPPEIEWEAETKKIKGLWGKLMSWRPDKRMQRLPPPDYAAPTFTGPFGDIVKTLEGSPAAATLEHTLNGAFASPVLPKRTKLLMFAVVARTLDCAICEANAARLLEHEGCSRATLDQVLATLGSPQLDAAEQILVPWARDTVWMPEQPARIQERTLPHPEDDGPRGPGRGGRYRRARQCLRAPDHARGMTGLLVVLLVIAAVTGAGFAWRARRLAAEVDRHRTALTRSVERLEHIERSFQRFAPLDVVEQIAQGQFATEPAHRRVTVLFADIKGFTPLSERIEPPMMVEMLNGYFRAMNGALTAHHGHLSRLMGDGLMALFGALEKNSWQTADAVQAALAMRAALVVYNRTLVAKGLPELEIGIGIHTGDVVAGVMGSDRFTEFTVIGDPVNLAARVEALTRVHGVDILITDAVQETLDGRFVLRAMAPVAVKGKSEPVTTFAVEDFVARPPIA